MVTGEQATKLSLMHFWVLFDALFEKGIIGYADIQGAIARLETMMDPADPDYRFLKMQAEIIARTYQPGKYQSPLRDRDPNDPQP